jgi:hypothetical protein
MLIGNFERVTLPDARAVLAQVTGRPVDISFDLRDCVQRCDDKRLRLNTTQLVCTDVVRVCLR